MPASSAGVDGAHTHPLPNGVSYDVSNQLLSIFMVFVFWKLFFFFNWLFGIHAIGNGSWKKRQVGNFQVRNEVREFEPKLENFCSLKTFQLRSVLSNLNGNFLIPDFPTQNSPSSIFPTALSKYLNHDYLNDLGFQSHRFNPCISKEAPGRRH